MIQLISLVIFFVAVSGIAIVLARKIPALVRLPQNGHHGFTKHEAIIKIEKRVKHLHFHFFEKQMLLQKLLSKTRVWILKIERWIDVALHGIRKKAQELDKKKR